MPRAPLRSPPYKELTLQQLRSFSETARLGSYLAAARSLGLTHPTVREQVLSLQREFGHQLLEQGGRGCRLTAEGRLLAEMVAPLVSGAATLKPRFESARKQATVRLTVAGPPRVIQEDLPAAVKKLLAAQPNLNLVFLETRDDQVVSSVASGQADIGLTTRAVPDVAPIGITFDTAYELETILLTPKNHPLAKRPNVTPVDLRKYPLLSSRYTLSDQPELATMLDRHRAFDGPKPRIEPFLAGTVRRYVAEGHGIAVVYGLQPQDKKSPLHERQLHQRTMTKHFGRGLVRFVFRNGTVNEDAAAAFATAVRERNRASE